MIPDLFNKGKLIFVNSEMGYKILFHRYNLGIRSDRPGSDRRLFVIANQQLFCKETTSVRPGAVRPVTVNNIGQTRGPACVTQSGRGQTGYGVIK